MSRPGRSQGRRALVWLIVLALGAGLLAEAALRLYGLGDFPLYDADAQIGYRLRPSQSGRFMRDHDWAFNALGMGVAAEFRAAEAGQDELLIGDSIVLGGNPMRQADRLGPRLQAAMQRRVWPISAGSWALLNELTWLRLHPEAARSVAHITMVLNTGDFDQASSWTCEVTHPRQHPVSVAWYQLRKALLPHWPCNSTPPPDLAVPRGDWRVALRTLMDQGVLDPVRMSIVLYPDRAECRDPARLYRELEVHAAELHAVLGSRVQIYSVGRDPRWQAGYYRDSVHPTERGDEVLADVIAHPGHEPGIRL